MKIKTIEIALIGTVLFSFFLAGCAIPSSGTRDNIAVEDSLELRGGCVISGKISDKETNEPVRGANVVVYSKPIRRETDLYGQFQIVDILPGTYILQIFCVGYEQKTITDIKARPNRMIKLDIRLEPRQLSR